MGRLDLDVGHLLFFQHLRPVQNNGYAICGHNTTFIGRGNDLVGKAAASAATTHSWLRDQKSLTIGGHGKAMWRKDLDGDGPIQARVVAL
jgi:hypothetical protein